MPLALIAGSGGQDGVYLTRLLHTKGFTVAGIDLGNPCRDVDRAYQVDLTDRDAVRAVVAESQPDEVYFLAAFHHSSEVAQIPEEELVAVSFDVNTLALNYLIGALTDFRAQARLLYASSSRVFGEPPEETQNEDTPLAPTEPYGISKAASMHLCRYWRRVRGVFAASAILYNHESPLRDPSFLSRKIVKAAVETAGGASAKLAIGDLEARVDWGHAADSVRAMWLMLQQPYPMDYVVATGQLHTIRDWLNEAFGILSLDWQSVVIENRDLLSRIRPMRALCGDSARLRQATGWEPTFSFKAMVRDMVKSELQRSSTAPVTCLL